MGVELVDVVAVVEVADVAVEFDVDSSDPHPAARDAGSNGGSQAT